MLALLLVASIAPSSATGRVWRPPDFASRAASRPAGALAERIERSLARLSKPPFTLRFISADVSFAEKRIFTEYSGDISGRVLGVSAMESDCGRTPEWDVAEMLRMLSRWQKPDGHFGADQDLKKDIVRDRDMPILWGNGRLLIGLVEAYRASENPLALEMARKLGDYYLNTDPLLDRSELVDKYGNYAAGFATCYFSGIEGLVGLSRITKDVRYREQAERMARLMATTTQPKEQHSHGRLCALRGLLDLFEATGKREYLDRVTAENEIWVQRFLWPTGGISEMSVPTFQRNEGCTEADWLRLNLQLWRLTGRDTYLDLAEKTLKNELAVDQFANGGFGHRVAAFAVGKMDGYYAGTHESTQEAYWCCSEHGPRALLDVAPSSVAVRGSDVYLNLYEAADTAIRIGGTTVKVVVRPEGLGDKVALTLEAERPISFALHLRVPGWCNDFRVDGKKLPRDAQGRVVIKRKWSGRTAIALEMPFAFRREGNEGASCLYYGPYLLVYSPTEDGKLVTNPPAVSLREVEQSLRKDAVFRSEISATSLILIAKLPVEAGFRCRVRVVP